MIISLIALLLIVSGIGFYFVNHFRSKWLGRDMDYNTLVRKNAKKFDHFVFMLEARMTQNGSPASFIAILNEDTPHLGAILKVLAQDYEFLSRLNRSEAQGTLRLLAEIKGSHTEEARDLMSHIWPMYLSLANKDASECKDFDLSFQILSEAFALISDNVVMENFGDRLVHIAKSSIQLASTKDEIDSLWDLIWCGDIPSEDLIPLIREKRTEIAEMSLSS